MTQVPEQQRLTLAQQRFVARYLETGNATEAYRFAYDAWSTKENTVSTEAWRLLRHPKIAPIIQRHEQQALDAATITKQYVLSGLKRNADAAAADGKYSASNGALELLGKSRDLRLFVESSESVSVHVDARDARMQGWSVEQLDAMAQALEAGTAPQALESGDSGETESES